MPNDSDRRDIEGDLGLTGELEPLGEFGLELRAAATDELGLELGQLRDSNFAFPIDVDLVRLLFRFEPSRLFFETRLLFPPELIWSELDFVKAGNLSPPTGEEGGADDDESMTL